MLAKFSVGTALQLIATVQERVLTWGWVSSSMEPHGAHPSTEAVADGFLTAWCHLGKVPSGSSLLGWEIPGA